MHVLLFFGAPLHEPRGDTWYFDAEDQLNAVGDVELVFYGESPSVRAALAATLSVQTIEHGSAVPVGCGSIQENSWRLKIIQAQQALGLTQSPSSWHVASVEDEDGEDWDSEEEMT
jgi:hypothetical protein